MANLLQGLIVLGFAGAVAARSAEFPHRVHLKMKLPCVGCHASVTTSTKAEDNNLPDPAICSTCHRGSSMTVKAPRTLFVAKFNHQLHLKFGNIAPVIAAAIDQGKYLSNPAGIRERLTTASQCTACHRGLEDSDSVGAEAGKRYFPQMADCLVCHNKIDPPDSCVQCHVGGPELKPANHSKDFLDAHTTGKLGLDRTTCAVCHGRRFTCLGCH